MSAPTDMELRRDTDERPIECDGCARDFPPSQSTQSKRFLNGKWHFEDQCPSCVQEEAECKAADLAAAQTIKPELESLVAKCESMSRDDLYEALHDLSEALWMAA